MTSARSPASASTESRSRDAIRTVAASLPTSACGTSPESTRCSTKCRIRGSIQVSAAKNSGMATRSRAWELTLSTNERMRRLSPPSTWTTVRTRSGPHVTAARTTPGPNPPSGARVRPTAYVRWRSGPPSVRENVTLGTGPDAGPDDPFGAERPSGRRDASVTDRELRPSHGSVVGQQEGRENHADENHQRGKEQGGWEPRRWAALQLRQSA